IYPPIRGRKRCARGTPAFRFGRKQCACRNIIHHARTAWWRLAGGRRITGCGQSMTPTSSERPLVSGILIVFNGERFLREAVESVLAQRYDRWELLIVDDGSTDSSAHIA